MENKGMGKKEEMGGSDLAEMLNTAISKLAEVQGSVDGMAAESVDDVLDILSDIKDKMSGDMDMDMDEDEEMGEDYEDDGMERKGGPTTISLIVRKAKKGAPMAVAMLLMLVGLAVKAEATLKVRFDAPPDPSIFMSESVYRSSVTCSGDTFMRIDTHTAIVSHITSTGATAGAWYQIWDTRESTAAGTNAYPVSIKHPSNTYSTINFKTGVSSGLAVIQDRNAGPAPCFEVWHIQR